MLAIIIVLLLLFVFDIIALRHGYDSRDGVESNEWTRRSSYGHSV